MALDWIKNKLSEGRNALISEIARYKNREFMLASIAVGTYIAFADGEVSSEEKQKLLKYFEMSDELKVFNTSEVIAEFKKLAEKFEFDQEIGRSEALKLISRVKDKTDAARTTVRLGVIIAKSDGNFDEAEKTALKEICRELGLAPEEFFQ